jgi:hypothetical protein
MAKLTKEQFLQLQNQAVTSGTREGRKSKIVAFLKAEIASGNKQIACITKDDLGLHPVGRYEVKKAIAEVLGVKEDVFSKKLGFIACSESEIEGYHKEKAFVLDLTK